MDIFLKDVSVRLRKLEDALGESDAMSAAREAHTILGVSSNIGANRVRDLALGLEKSARKDDLVKAAPLGKKLGEESLKAVRSAWEDNEPYDLICLDIMMPKG